MLNLQRRKASSKEVSTYLLSDYGRCGVEHLKRDEEPARYKGISALVSTKKEESFLR
jgi:hypothetical protein